MKTYNKTLLVLRELVTQETPNRVSIGKALNMTGPVISYQIEKLEKEYGVALKHPENRKTGHYEIVSAGVFDLKVPFFDKK